ncbi:MAG: HIT domain-containing protein [bacterium]|nr:HIT domain-containing protein [bacterium]
MEKPCVFCDRSQLEERLIAETRTLYFVATLGQITDGGYTIIIPKRHVSCVGAMEEREVEEVEAAMVQTSDAIEMEYGVRPVIFEHGIVGQTIQHAHLHLMPAQIRLDNKIHLDFPETKINVVSSLEVLRRLYEEGKKYLLYNMPAVPQLYFPAGIFHVAWNPPAPPQYLRTVSAELMGRPKRANWRNMDPELDRQLWSETVQRLKKYYS